MLCYCTYLLNIQLFGERLSEKVHATIPKGIVGGWFWVHFSSKKFKRLAREAMDICLRVLRESNKSRFDSYSVRNSLSIRRFWGKRGEMEAKKRESSSPPSPLPHQKSRLPYPLRKAWYSGYVRNSVLIISHITFRDCRAHIFSDNLSRNSCICIAYRVFLNKRCFRAVLFEAEANGEFKLFHLD